jgi:hypothetical protein
MQVLNDDIEQAMVDALDVLALSLETTSLDELKPLDQAYPDVELSLVLGTIPYSVFAAQTDANTLAEWVQTNLLAGVAAEITAALAINPGA